MPSYRLTFRGMGFADACDPTGRQIIDGFCAKLVHTGATKECAIAAARDELMKNSQVRHLIDETHAIKQEEGTWTIECEEARKLLFWWLRPRHCEPKIDFHWSPAHNIDPSKMTFQEDQMNGASDHCTDDVSSVSHNPARE